MKKKDFIKNLSLNICDQLPGFINKDKHVGSDALLSDKFQDLFSIPAIELYINVSDKNVFLNKLKSVAEKDGFKLFIVESKNEHFCPECSIKLKNNEYNGLSCTSCNIIFETLYPLSLIKGFRIVFSFRLIKEILDFPEVLTYQVEGRIHTQIKKEKK